MRGLADALAAVLAALWVGGTWAIGYLAVPVLFRAAPDRQLAGMIAGQMFTLLAYLGIATALYLAAHQLRRYGRAAWQRSALRLVLLMLLLVLLGQFVIQPILADLKHQALPLDVMSTALAASFKTWHAVAGVLYLAQSLLGIALLLAMRGETPVTRPRV